MRHSLSLSASILVIVYCGAAHAQSESAATGTSASSFEEVVVTAERRSENLMTSPVTASVLTSQDIANKNIFNVNSLQFVAPSITINDLGQGVDFNIRGIGKGEHNTQTPAGVVTYRDGAATFPGYLTAEPYFDIKSVEIYRGPQGTFVGQNATGGAVFVTTNDPQLGGSYGGYAQVQYGNYNTVQLQGAVDIPITDDLAMRLSVFGQRRDSFYTVTDSDPADACPGNKYVGCKDGYNAADMNWAAGRVSILWEPTSDFSLSVKYDLNYLDYGAALSVPFYQRFPVGTPVAPYGIPNPVHSDLFHVTSNAPQSRLDRQQRLIVKGAYTFANGIKLQSISDYNSGSGLWKTDLDGTDYGNVSATPFFGDTAHWTFKDQVGETLVSQEFNLVSPDNQPITWVAGAYWQSDIYHWIPPYQFYIAVGPRIGTDPTPSASNFYQYTSQTFQGHTSNSTLAGFGQVEAKLGGGVSASLGGRWTRSTSKNTVTFWNYGVGPLLDEESQKSYNLSYKAALDWAVNDNNYLYAFVATGYKGGGLNTIQSSGAIPSPFGPETNTDYELGWKGTGWFGGHVHTQLNAYYTVYNDFQVVLPSASNPTQSYEINVPKASKIYGLEASTQANFGDFSFNANLGWMKSKIGTLWAVDSRLGAGAGTCDPSTGGTNPNCINLKGNAQTYAPHLTFNFGLQYVFHLENGNTITPRLNFSHQAEQWATLFEHAQIGDHLGARNLLGAQLEWQSGSWLVTLYGTNLTNQQYVAALNSGALYAGPPRQFGIRLMKAF